MRATLLFALVWLVMAAATAGANDPLQTGQVRVGVFVSPPFVIEENYGGYSGFAVELWETVAKGMDVKSEYVRYHTVKDLLQAAADEKIDIVVLSIAVTYDRSQSLRYSFPWFDSGLRLMINTENKRSFWSEMTRFRHFRMYAIFSIIFAFMAIGMTMLRRSNDPKFPPDWKTGLTKSLLDVVASVKSGRLDQAYLGWLGSLLSVLWMIFGVGVAAYVTSSITSSMTTASLNRGDVSTLAEIMDQRIGVQRGSISEEYLRSLDMNVVLYDSIPDAAKALAANEIHAVVCDDPILKYYIRTHPDMPLTVVGEQFQREKYGFVTSIRNREFMDRVSEELIWLYETETILSLQRRYLDDLR